MRTQNPILLQAQSAVSTIYSSPIPAAFLMYGSAQAEFSSSTAAGSITLQGSNDSPSNLPAGEAPQNWSTIPGTSQTVTAGATTMIPTTQLCYQYVRFAWVPTTGAGTITATGTFQGPS